MNKQRIAVIGAGPAGMTAAYELSKNPAFEVDLYEASPFVGGMARSFPLFGQIVDLGPHRFFSSAAKVNRLWLEVIGKEYRMVNRLTRILYGRKFYSYPLRPFEALARLGPFESARCGISYLLHGGKARPDNSSFEAWVVSAFGRRLFEIFFKTYSEKLWGIPCDELDSDFAAQRIRKLSLWEAIKNGLVKRDNQHKTLVDKFAYPKLGTGQVYEKMADFVTAHGNRVLRKTPVERVVLENGKVAGVQLTSGATLAYDHVISSMPITLLMSRLPDVPADVREKAARLRFRNTTLVYLEVDSTRLFEDNWLYVHSADLLMGRITNFRNWSPDLYGNAKTSILALEYWSYDEDDFWKWDDAKLIELASKELKSTGLIGESKILQGHVSRVPRCYPVYFRGYKDLLKPVEDYLSSIPGLTVIGRYGAYKYNNQDHSILMGMLAAEKLSGAAKHDLWSVNTDYDDYQESAVITEEGLVTK